MHTPRRRSRRPLAPVAVTTALALTAVLAPGSAYAVVTTEAIETIAAVQGTGDASPLVGRTVTVEGIITADHRAEDSFGGVHLQTAGSGGPSDTTPGASDAVFVLLADEDPVTPTATLGAIGDRVSVTGVVEEASGQTQIDARSEERRVG